MPQKCEKITEVWRPVLGWCRRTLGHEDACFVVSPVGMAGFGAYIHEGETQFVDSPDDWPEDIIMSDIERHEITAIYDPPGVTSRRAAIEAQKVRKSAGN